MAKKVKTRKNQGLDRKRGRFVENRAKALLRSDVTFKYKKGGKEVQIDEYEDFVDITDSDGFSIRRSKRWFLKQADEK